MQHQAGSERDDTCAAEGASSQAPTAEVTPEADPQTRRDQSVLHNVLKVLSPLLWLLYLKIKNTWTIAVIVFFLYGTDKQSPCCLYDSETPAQDNFLYNLLLYAWMESRCMRKLLV